MSSEDRAPVPQEPRWHEDDNAIARERRKEYEWESHAIDLKAKKYLSDDTDIAEFVSECRQYANNNSTAYILDIAADQCGATFGTLLAAGAVLVREAADLNNGLGLRFEELSELSATHYPAEPTKTPSPLRNDVGELAIWTAEVIEKKHLKKDEVDRHQLRVLTARLNELLVRCYCTMRGWEPSLKTELHPKKQRNLDP